MANIIKIITTALQRKLTAGTNITIDESDPLNPIINAEGGDLEVDVTPIIGATSGNVLSTDGANLTQTPLKTINGASVIGSGDLVVASTDVPVTSSIISGNTDAAQAGAVADTIESPNNDTGGGYQIIDENGNVSLSIDKIGLVDINPSAKTIDSVLKYIGISKTLDGNFTIEDNEGNVALSISNLGVVDFTVGGANLSEFIKSFVNNESSDSVSIEKPVLNNLADVNHVVNYGQSLSVGQTEKVVTVKPPFGNVITFGNSVITSAYSEDYPTNLTSFTPLHERTYTATSDLKETPTSGICEKLYKEIISSTLVTNKSLKILGSAPGQGSATVASLDKPSTYYNRVLADVTAGKSVSDGLGLTYKCIGVTWTQGESDYLNATTKASYKATLTQLITDLNTDIKAITGQTDDIRFVSYQTATINDHATIPNIALAQYELAIDDSSLLEMATPMYFMGYNDTFHLQAVYSKLMGMYYGKCLNRPYETSKNKPLFPVGHIINGNDLQVDFYVPVSPIAFQPVPTNEVITNQGFRVMKASVDILTSVSLNDNGTSLNMICSEDPTGSILDYGFQKGTITNSKVSIGFMRDSNGIYEQEEIDGETYQMSNWCPVLEYTL